MLNKKGDKLFRFTNEFVPFFEFGDKQLDCTVCPVLIILIFLL